MLDDMENPEANLTPNTSHALLDEYALMCTVPTTYFAQAFSVPLFLSILVEMDPKFTILKLKPNLD